MLRKVWHLLDRGLNITKPERYLFESQRSGSAWKTTFRRLLPLATQLPKLLLIIAKNVKYGQKLGCIWSPWLVSAASVERLPELLRDGASVPCSCLMRSAAAAAKARE